MMYLKLLRSTLKYNTDLTSRPIPIFEKYKVTPKIVIIFCFEINPTNASPLPTLKQRLSSPSLLPSLLQNASASSRP
jgi:hypothetical protein